MVVDIAPQQQLTELFTTNHTHHRSSSSSSTLRRNSNSASSMTSTNQTTINNGHRVLADELSKKAEQILGHATEVFEYGRQTSVDLHGQYPFRWSITEPKPTPSSRNMASSTSVHNSSSSLSSKTVSSDPTDAKTKPLVTVEQLLPLIFQLVAPLKLTRFPEMISRPPSNSKPVENVLNSREMTLALHRQNVVQLSDDDDENEDEDDDNGNNNNPNRNSVLIDTTDKKIANIINTSTTHNNNNNSSSINQNNSNENPSASSVLHRYENQTEIEHSGRTSSRYQEDDSEDDDSDNPEAAHSDAENEHHTDSTNPHTLSLMDFISRQEPYPEPEPIATMKKRSISPDNERDDDHPVHNCEEHQNKRKKLLIKRALLKSFVSSVNTRIDFKRPSLPITIPTHLLFDQSNDETMIERTSKRDAQGALKHDNTVDTIDASNLSNVTHQKKNKTSHVQEKNSHKPETSTFVSNTTSNELDHRLRPSLTTTSTAIVSPVTTNLQPKKEKPTANVKPLQQSTTIDTLSSSNSFNNGANTSDNLTSTPARSMLPQTKMNYAKLKNMSTTDLTALARRKKKQADGNKRTTFAEAREAMSLYLESVCYFIQCANDESKLEQRIALLSTTLNMLQQLIANHQKIFHVPNQSVDVLFNIREKFFLINYWLQSLIYHLQFNTNMPSIERAAAQVTEYFHQLKNPSSAAALTKTHLTNGNNQQQQQQTTPINDSNPISPLSVASQTSASDSSSSIADQHRCMLDFSKLMLNSYYSTYYWNKAERISREKSLKEFAEQLKKQNQNRRLSRDETTLDFLLYMFDAIELLRVSVA